MLRRTAPRPPARIITLTLPMAGPSPAQLPWAPADLISKDLRGSTQRTFASCRNLLEYAKHYTQGSVGHGHLHGGAPRMSARFAHE
jgi:hypothetical protein